MARIKKGILGGFSGKVGTVIGANWRGIDYMRALPRLSNKPATPAQLAQRNKMALLRGFLTRIQDIIDERVQNIGKYTAMNEVLSYSLLHTIVGKYPNQEIDLTKLMFSKGVLMGCWEPKVKSEESRSIEFSWGNGSFTPFRNGDDMVTIVVYDTVLQQFCILKDAGKRKNGSATMLVPPKFSNHKVHCYISFYAQKKKLASASEYIGQVKIA